MIMKVAPPWYSARGIPAPLLVPGLPAHPEVPGGPPEAPRDAGAARCSDVSGRLGREGPSRWRQALMIAGNTTAAPPRMGDAAVGEDS